ncbi:hypothetical protein B0H14DRAFT_2830245, partial [Mycena olivaceomarginata]
MDVWRDTDNESGETEGKESSESRRDGGVEESMMDDGYSLVLGWNETDGAPTQSISISISSISSIPPHLKLSPVRRPRSFSFPSSNSSPYSSYSSSPSCFTPRKPKSNSSSRRHTLAPALPLPAPWSSSSSSSSSSLGVLRLRLCSLLTLAL